MNKAQLVEQVAAKSKLTKKQADDAVTSVLHVIATEVANGEKVTLVGFGTFDRRDRKERTGRNPSTGQSLIIPATRVPRFSPGKQFKEKVANLKRTWPI